MSEKDPLINSAHEAFVQHIANGMHAKDAYIQVFPNTKKRNANKSASRLMHRPEVIARVDYLKRCNAELSKWTRSDAMDILRNIAENPAKKDCDRINAVNLLNQMCGFTEPEKKIIAQTTFFQFISPDKGIPQE